MRAKEHLTRTNKSRHNTRVNRNKKTLRRYSRKDTQEQNLIGNNNNHHVIMVEKTKVEYLLLFNALVNYYVLLVSRGFSNEERKTRLGELLGQMRNGNKFISRDTTALQIQNIVNYLDAFFNQLLILINKSLDDSTKTRDKKNTKRKNNTNRKSHHHGGFYFKSLEEKGDKPITGADLTKLLDEMQQFFYNAKYTQEGQFLQDTDTLLSMLRGDISQFRGFMQYRIFPQFYNFYPPYIKWDAIYHELIEKRRWEDLPDYLLAYQSYLRSRDEYLVEKGLKPPSILQRDLYTGFYNKMANSINDNMYAFQNARNKFQGRFFPITLPS